MRALGFPIKKIDVVRYFKEIPKDISDSLTFDDFCIIVAPIMPKRDSKEEIYKVFSLFDEDKTGKISFKNLKKIAAEAGEQLTDDEIKDMIDEADRTTHKEGLIDFEDFFKVMKKNCDDPLGEFDSDEDEDGVYEVKNNKLLLVDP